MASDALLDGRLKLRHLRIALTISEQGSLVRAAAALHVTQPVVTRALSELEGLLGATLFIRGAKGVTLTEFGESFLRKAATVAAHLRDVQRDIDLRVQGRGGRLIIGNHLSGSLDVLPRAIAEMKVDAREVSITVREGSPDQLKELLRSGKVDLVVGRLSNQFNDDDFHLEELYREAVRVIARAGHPLAQRASLSLVDLQDYDWILPLPDTALRGEIERCFMEQQVPVPPHPIECTSAVMIREIVHAGDTVAIGSWQIVQAPESGLIALPVQLNVRRSVGVITSATREVTPVMTRFLDALQLQARRLTEHSKVTDSFRG